MRIVRPAVALGLGLLMVAGAAWADEAEVHTFHCLHGCPVGTASTNDLVVREIYTLSSNDQTKLADWVAYRTTPQTIGPSKDRVWAADPWLAGDETLEPDDYTGAFQALQTDRGHQAPLAAFSGTEHWADTNFLSNITPQKSALNQASWQHLEAKENALVLGEQIALYVLTGPLYERVMPPLPNADEPHRIPSGYWKVIAAADGRMSAFIFDQETPRSADYCAMRVGVADVELRSRLRLFPRAPDTAFTSLDGALGCS